MPQISVVMSVYNSERYLHQAVESILNQSFSDFEFIIIDDGSSDHSSEILLSYQRDPRVKIVNQSNRGLSHALNRAIGLAGSQFIARMDADDISRVDRLQKQFNFLVSNPDCILTGSNVNYINTEGRYLYTSALPLSWDKIQKILPRTPVYHSSVMFRKSAWEKAGGYREDIKHHFEDRILWNQFAKLGELRNLNEALLDYRLVPSSISNNDRKTIRILDEICSRVIETGILSSQDKKNLELVSQRTNENKRMANYFLRIGVIYLSENFNRKEAWKHLIKSLRSDPRVPATYYNLALCFLPSKLVCWWKKNSIRILKLLYKGS